MQATPTIPPNATPAAIEAAIGVARAEFDRLSPQLDAALAHGGGTHDREDVWALILAGEAALWPGKSSIIVTEVQRAPRRATLHFWLAGGDLAEIREMIAAIEDRARAAGIKFATTAGRDGWQRALREAGYRPRWHVCEKEL